MNLAVADSVSVITEGIESNATGIVGARNVHWLVVVVVVALVLRVIWVFINLCVVDCRPRSAGWPEAPKNLTDRPLYR